MRREGREDSEKRRDRVRKETREGREGSEKRREEWERWREERE